MNERLKFTPDEMRLYQDEVNKSNYRTLRFFALIWLPLSVINIFAQSIADPMPIRYAFSSVLLVYFSILSIVLIRYRPVSFKYSTLLLYASQVIPMLDAILLGTVLDPLNQAVTIFGFITLMPVLILDKKKNIITWILMWTLLFTVISYFCKAPAIFRGDLIHTVEFSVISIAVTLSVLDTRMASIRNYVIALPAFVDPLTGLQSMQKFLENAASIREEASEPLSIAYFNTAGLKKYNEDYGYQAGSDLLRRIAETLEEEFGQKNCSRFSDDHFVVLTKTSVIRDKIESAVRKMTSYARTCPTLAGVYELQPDDRMEIACDRAKTALDSLRLNFDGKSVQYYDADFEKAQSHNHYVQYHLEEAVEKGWIETYFQPIIRTSTNHVCNMEALARWNDPNFGLFSPSQFVPILENCRKLHLLDLEIIRQAAAAVAKLETEGLPVCPISVNLSRYDFEAADMVRTISEILDRAGVSHRMIVIEITESALINQEELIAREIDRFHEAGFKVWMDDFGSGWSSLNLLTKFHFDQIKLDMEFVLRMHEHKHNKLVVRHMLELSQQLGIDTLAEGVETEEQYLILKKLGCDKLQGYYFSRPISMEKLLEMLRSRMSIPYEKLNERDYYDAVGSVSFTDELAGREDSANDRHGLEMPMAIVEMDGRGNMTVLRANELFIDIIERYGMTHDSFSKGEAGMVPEVADAFAGLYRSAVSTDSWTPMTDIIVMGGTFTFFARRICSNPVTRRDALFLAMIDYR